MKEFSLRILLYFGWALASWWLIFDFGFSYEKLQVYAWVVSLALVYICAKIIVGWAFKKKGEDK